MNDKPDKIDPTTALFEQAVAEHSRRLLAIARAIVGYRASGEDVLQQALLNLFQHRHRYDWREPGALMRRTVVNQALRVLRSPRLASMSDDPPTEHDAPIDPLLRNETVAAVRAAIDQLPEHFRAALVLCEYEQLSYNEIARTLDCSVAQVKTWLFRARTRLAEMLADHVEYKRKRKTSDDRKSSLAGEK